MKNKLGRKLEKLIRLNGLALVIIDWANVYSWQKSLKQRIEIKSLYSYLLTYSQIKELHFYFGTDKHQQSKKFLKKVKKIGFKVHTKPVKYIKINREPLIEVRKCDFDLEIALDVMDKIDQYRSFIFFSGDGDFATLYRKLMNKHKQVVVVYHPDSLGREIWQMKNELFLLDINKIKKIIPGVKPGE